MTLNEKVAEYVESVNRERKEAADRHSAYLQKAAEAADSLMRSGLFNGLSREEVLKELDNPAQCAVYLKKVADIVSEESLGQIVYEDTTADGGDIGVFVGSDA